MVDPASPFAAPAQRRAERLPEAPENLFDEEDEPVREWGSNVDLRSLLKTQLHLTNELQRQLVNGGLNSLPPREVKELLTAVGSMLTLAHRTDEVLRELETYKLLLEVVFAWVEQRSDSTGEDLLAELRRVGSEMRNSEGVSADKLF